MSSGFSAATFHQSPLVAAGGRGVVVFAEVLSFRAINAVMSRSPTGVRVKVVMVAVFVTLVLHERCR
jgi:hypothetical protein